MTYDQIRHKDMCNMMKDLRMYMDFYKAVAQLTYHHDEVGGFATVFPEKIDKELAKIDPEWWDKMWIKSKETETLAIRACGNPKCSTSTGIHEGLTFGSGKLDDNGYWENPCAICARHHEKLDKTPENSYWPSSIVPNDVQVTCDQCNKSFLIPIREDEDADIAAWNRSCIRCGLVLCAACHSNHQCESEDSWREDEEMWQNSVDPLDDFNLYS